MFSRCCLCVTKVGNDDRTKLNIRLHLQPGQYSAFLGR